MKQGQEFAAREEQKNLANANAEYGNAVWQALWNAQQLTDALADARAIPGDSRSSYPCPYLLPSITPRCARGHVLCKMEAEFHKGEDDADCLDAVSNYSNSGYFRSMDREPATDNEAVHFQQIVNEQIFYISLISPA